MENRRNTLCDRCGQYYVGMRGVRRHQSGPHCTPRLERERMREMLRAGLREREQRERDQARLREEEIQREVERRLEERRRRMQERQRYRIQGTIRIDLFVNIV